MDEAFKLAKEISKEHDKSTIIILLIIGIIYFLANLIISVVLSFITRRNEIKRIRSERKLDSAENVIEQLRLLSSSLSIIDSNNISDGKEKINKLRIYVCSKDFLLSNDLSNLANDLLDYYAVVLVTPEKRDTNMEKKFFINMKKAYEKIL